MDDGDGSVRLTAKDPESSIRKGCFDTAVLYPAIDLIQDPRKAAGEGARHEVSASRESPVGGDQMFPPLKHHGPDAAAEEPAQAPLVILSRKWWRCVRSDARGTKMSKRRRTVIGIMVIELLLAALWYYLHTKMAMSANATAESAEVIGQMMGGAMGLILGLSPVLYLLARRNDLNAEKSSSD